MSFWGHTLFGDLPENWTVSLCWWSFRFLSGHHITSCIAMMASLLMQTRLLDLFKLLLPASTRCITSCVSWFYFLDKGQREPKVSLKSKNVFLFLFIQSNELRRVKRYTYWVWSSSAVFWIFWKDNLKRRVNKYDLWHKYFKSQWWHNFL